MPTHKPHLVKHSIWFIIAIGIGVGIAALVLSAGRMVYSQDDTSSPLSREQQTKENEQKTITNADNQPTYYTLSEDGELDIDAEAWLMADLSTGQILRSHGRKVTYPIASITKLMTALTLDSMSDGNEELTVTSRALATEGWRGNLEKKDTFSPQEIRYPLLLVSSNDAAEVIAGNFGRENFIKQMNSMGDYLGMHNTTFEDPSGLSSENVSTAEDLFILLQYIHENNPEILDITDRAKYAKDDAIWENANRIRKNFETFQGGKTGYTSAAKHTGVAYFTITLSGGHKRDIALVLLNTKQRKEDIEKLLDYMKRNIHYGDQESVEKLYQQIET